MNLLRLFALLVGYFTLVTVTAASVADDKAPDKDKIVGDWKLSKSGGKRVPNNVVLQFTKDGKFKYSTTGQGLAKGGRSGKKVSVTDTTEGTFKVDGGKLILILKQRGKEDKRTATIVTLTEKKLITVDSEGREDEFEKMK